MNLNPTTALDFYKTDHARQYPEGTSFVYSNFTARSAAHAKMSQFFDNKVVAFGFQAFVQWYLVDSWNRDFFSRPVDEVVGKYKRRMDNALGPDSVNVDRIQDLHKLGFLPILIKAMPEGSRVDIKVPLFTVQNTQGDFFWLTNYLETVMSTELWKKITVATIAHDFRRQLDYWVAHTGSSPEFADWQNHDFSMRGMSGLHDAASSCAGHLLSNFGTDTVPAIDHLEEFYGANSDKDLIGGSVPATEHSVMCMGGKEDEIETFRRLIQDVYPSGIVSIVSDTWDFWKVISEYAVTLKSEILARTPNGLGQAKVVFRPDSGDPVEILCGDESAAVGSPAYKGAVECLWDTFGGTVTDKGFKTLHERVGLIYGDSITIERHGEILKRLADKGFSAGNAVFGIGSYTYQYITRDTFGMAMKATYGVVNGEQREIYKDPVTDVGGTKKSARGFLRVEREGNHYVLHDRQLWWEETNGRLEVIFINGTATNIQTLAQIRARLKSETQPSTGA